MCGTGEGEEEERKQEQERRKAWKKEYKASEVTGRRREWAGLAVGLLLPTFLLTMSESYGKQHIQKETACSVFSWQLLILRY